MAEKEKKASKYTLVNAIMTRLGIGDLGKVESFIAKEIKALKRKLVAINRNKDNTAFNHETAMEKLQDNLVDAKAELEASYENIEPEGLGSKAAQSDYSGIYWGRIDRAEESVKDINDEIEKAEEAHSDSLKYASETIKSIENKISKLSSEK